MVNSTLSLNDLPPEEQTAVAQLKQRMIGYMDNGLYEDLSTFVRFLRARDLNINAAEAMLKNHIEWRKINQIETILTDYTPKEVARKYITFDSMGVDKEGSPILYFNVGGLDSRGLLKSLRKSEIIKHIVQKLETNILLMKKKSNEMAAPFKLSYINLMVGVGFRREFKRMYWAFETVVQEDPSYRKLDKYIDKWTMILNFENLSFGTATHKETLELIGHLITMYEGNYPERLKVAYFINSSIYFTMAFAVVKHFLSAKTYNKINFFGKEGWREELLKIVDDDVLPGFLGGSRTDPDGDPLCPSIITHGGQVPASYFVKKKQNSIMNVPGVEKVTVTRKSKTQLTLDVTEPGSHIEWEFETKSRDIGFSLLFKKNNFESRLKVLIPKQRIDTDMSSETGMFKCDMLGIYIIEFDNSYSWIHQKEIYYKITVVKNQLIK